MGTDPGRAPPELLSGHLLRGRPRGLRPLPGTSGFGQLLQLVQPQGRDRGAGLRLRWRGRPRGRLSGRRDGAVDLSGRSGKPLLRGDPNQPGHGQPRLQPADGRRGPGLRGASTSTPTRTNGLQDPVLAQTLVNAQLKGEHRLGFLGDAKFDWRGAWSRAERYEPNTREVLSREENGEFLFENFVSSGSIFHQNLVDDTYSGSADLVLPFTLGGGDRTGSFAVGGALSSKQRDVFTRRFRFLMVPGGVIDDNVRRLDPNQLFNSTTIATDGFELQEATFRPDNYDATEDISAGYVKLEAELHPAVKVMTGVRVESARQEVAPFDLFTTGLTPIPGARPRRHGPPSRPEPDVSGGGGDERATGSIPHPRTASAQRARPLRLRGLRGWLPHGREPGAEPVSDPELRRPLGVVLLSRRPGRRERLLQVVPGSHRGFGASQLGAPQDLGERW